MRIRAPISFILPIAILLAWPLPALSLDSEDVVRMLHEDIIKKFPNYKEEKQKKALAACVNWDATTASSVNVRHPFYYYEGEHTDHPVFISRLMHSAVNACNRLRKKHKSTCECVPIDKNNKSVLKIPQDVVEVLLARGVGPSEPQSAYGDLVISDTRRNLGPTSDGLPRWRPGDKVKSFTTGEDELAFFFVKLYNLQPGTNYDWEWRFFDSDNLQYWDNPKFTKTLTQPAWNFWHTLYLTPAVTKRAGLWRVEFVLNDVVAKEGTFSVHKIEDRPVQASEPNTYFDGPWRGTMMCGTCENCVGPLTKEVQIDIQEGSFEIVMDATYHGEGAVDKKGNMEFHFTAWEDYWTVRSPPTFEFAGKFSGKAFQLEGTRGSRKCDLSFSRLTS